MDSNYKHGVFSFCKKLSHLKQQATGLSLVLVRARQ